MLTSVSTETIHVTNMLTAPITLDHSPADVNQGFMEMAFSAMVSSNHMIILQKTRKSCHSSHKTTFIEKE